MWKRLEKTLKNRSPGTLKIMILLGRVAKKRDRIAFKNISLQINKSRPFLKLPKNYVPTNVRILKNALDPKDYETVLS